MKWIDVEVQEQQSVTNVEPSDTLVSITDTQEMSDMKIPEQCSECSTPVSSNDSNGACLQQHFNPVCLLTSNHSR